MRRGGHDLHKKLSSQPCRRSGTGWSGVWPWPGSGTRGRSMMILLDAPDSAEPETGPPDPAGTRRHPWARHAGRRLLGLVGAFIGLIVITFAVVHLAPGDPAVLVAGQGATAADIQRVRVHLGLTQPLIVQFGKYVGNIFRFNLGESWQTGTPLSVLLRQNLGNSLILAGLALALVLI